MWKPNRRRKKALEDSVCLVSVESRLRVVLRRLARSAHPERSEFRKVQEEKKFDTSVLVVFSTAHFCVVLLPLIPYRYR